MKNYTLLAFWLCITLCYMHDIQPSGYEYQSMLCDPLLYTNVDMSKFGGSRKSMSFQNKEIDKFVFHYTGTKFINAIKYHKNPENIIELLSVIKILDLNLYPANTNYDALFYENQDQLGPKYMKGGFVQCLCNGDYTEILPLHSTVYSDGNIDTIKILLDHGANPNKLDDYDHTALDYATNPLTIKLLLQHYAKYTSPRSIKRLIKLQVLHKIDKKELIMVKSQLKAGECGNMDKALEQIVEKNPLKNPREIDRIIDFRALPKTDQEHCKYTLKIKKYDTMDEGLEKN